MRVTLAVLLLTCASAATVPRFTDPARSAKLRAVLPEVEKVFERFQQQRQIPGLAYGVVIDGETVLIKGLGVRERTSNDPVTRDTVFRIASMTKSFTALAILSLRDEGKLSLEDPVSKWIPEFEKFVYPTSDTAPIRIRQLLSHAAGFPEDNPWGDRQLGATDETLTRWLRKGLPFSTPPDTAYEYSNYGFALLGRIVATAAKMSYRDYLEAKILAPLGMRSTTLETSAVPEKMRAMGYRKTDAGYAEEPGLPHGAFGSMGGLWTTAEDLGRYVAFHLSVYPPRDGAETGPVRRSSVREMQRLARPGGFRVDWPAQDGPVRAVADGYGYGLRISRDCRFDHIVGHGGGLPGFGSYMLWLPDYGVGLFAMANLTYAGPAAPIDEALEIFRKTGALRPRELPASPELQSARDSIFALWEGWNQQTAQTLVADNFFRDRPAAERRREIEKLKTAFGACRPASDMRAENLLRGKFRLMCDQGSVEVVFTLAPTMPPKLQTLAFVPAHKLSAGLKAAVETVAAQFGTQSEDRIGAVAAASFDASALRYHIVLLQASYGACRAGETAASDGSSFVRVRLQCDRGPLDAELRLDAQGKITAASFSRPADTACMP